MSDWNRGRDGRYDGMDRDDFPRRGETEFRGDRERSFRDDHEGSYPRTSRWGSGDYRQNIDRERMSRGRMDPEQMDRDRWALATGMDVETDRDEFAGARDRDHFKDDYSRERSHIRRSEAENEAWNRPRSSGPAGTHGYADQSNLMEHRAGISPIQRGYERSFGTTYGSDTPLRGQTFRGRGPKGFQRSDERVRELVSERLEDHDAIDASDIEVTVNGGEVTLSGTVDDRRTKRLAEDVAESVAGVKDVHNNLKVDRNFFSRMADTIRDAVESPKDPR
jgi:hypothetical protein